MVVRARHIRDGGLLLEGTPLPLCGCTRHSRLHPELDMVALSMYNPLLIVLSLLFLPQESLIDASSACYW